MCIGPDAPSCMEAQHDKRVKLVFWRGKIEISRMEVEKWLRKNGHEATNLTFRIRTTSVRMASDSCYPGEERGTHVSIRRVLALTLTSQP